MKTKLRPLKKRSGVPKRFAPLLTLRGIYRVHQQVKLTFKTDIIS